jgi:hypothetical protein
MATVTDHKLYSLLNNELSSYSDVVDTLLTDRKSSLDGGGYYNPAPELLSMNVDGATGVNVSNNIVLTFSENIEARSGHVTLTSGSEHISIPVSDEKQITVSGKTVTINPTDDLSAGKTYYLTVDYKAFVDGTVVLLEAFSTLFLKLMRMIRMDWMHLTSRLLRLAAIRVVVIRAAGIRATM